MKASMAIPVLLGFATAASSHVVAASAGNKHHSTIHDRISPELDPKSDQVFFRSDYPDDSDASFGHPDHEPPSFTHPYPALQDSHDFDADYVKDENNDNGEWKAQMTYDLLRSKAVKRREDLAHKQHTLDEIRRELEEARRRYATAKDATAKAKKDADASDNAYGSATDKYKRLAAGGGAAGDVTSEGSDEVESAMSVVKREMRHLEKCRKQLAAARAKLKALLAKPPGAVAAGAPLAAPPLGLAPGAAPAPAAAAAAAAMSPAGAARAPAPSPFASPASAPAPAMKTTASRQDDELSKLEKESAIADASAADRVAKAAEAKRLAAKRAGEADEAKERHRTFQLEKQEEAKQLKEDELALKKAAERLRRFRQAEDSDGGVYWKDEQDGKKKRAADGGIPGMFTNENSAAAPQGAGFILITISMVAAVTSSL